MSRRRGYVRAESEAADSSSTISIGTQAAA
jgi:hypothetical protein